jgi:hypothetical protein
LTDEAQTPANLFPIFDIAKSSRIGFQLVIHLDHLVTMIRPRSLFRPLALRLQFANQILQFGTNVKIESTDHFLDARHIFVKRFYVTNVTVKKRGSEPNTLES